MIALTLTVRALAGSNQFEFEASTAAGLREAYAVGTRAVVVAAMTAFVGALQ